MRKPSIVASLALLAAFVSGPATAAPQDGFLYGTVQTSSGTTYTGFLRWGTQETFWDDLFHSAKQDLPYVEAAEDFVDEDSQDTKRQRIRVFGYRIEWDSDGLATSRVFIARFGDIASIEITGDEEATIIMKSGEKYAVEGYSDDVGGEIHVIDAERGESDLKWNRIERIDFKAAPASAKPAAQRLRGVVKTSGGEFGGFVQWDSEECLSSDELDGESEDGDVSIEFSRIASIERRGRRSSIVELRDGTTQRLRGSNDVNQENRGIYVETPSGRVKIPWEEFDRVDFELSSDSGKSYDDYPALGFLEGKVIDRDGKEYAGRVVFDLDEAEGWEMLNGSDRDLEYLVPFALIASIKPRGDEESVVKLRSGIEIVLSDSQDVAQSNDGVLIYADGKREPQYLAWDKIEEIRFDR